MELKRGEKIMVLEDRLEYERLYSDFSRESKKLNMSFKQYAEWSERGREYSRMLMLCKKEKSSIVYETLKKL